MVGDIQVDLKLVGPTRQITLPSPQGQKPSTNVGKLKSELMAILTAEIQDPNSQDIQGDWLEEQLSDDEQKPPKTRQRKQRNKRKAEDS
ncbi:hypothetical protein WJX84_010208 [Apatococcus fuscideae]|uniref:Uncharacterized protein n=1 Tax=Apatococcus fuscideae TaxID=2026836 RepID=A0AAW1SXS5_9CHLO